MLLGRLTTMRGHENIPILGFFILIFSLFNIYPWEYRKGSQLNEIQYANDCQEINLLHL